MIQQLPSSYKPTMVEFFQKTINGLEVNLVSTIKKLIIPYIVLFSLFDVPDIYLSNQIDNLGIIFLLSYVFLEFLLYVLFIGLLVRNLGQNNVEVTLNIFPKLVIQDLKFLKFACFMGCLFGGICMIAFGPGMNLFINSPKLEILEDKFYASATIFLMASFALIVLYVKQLIAKPIKTIKNLYESTKLVLWSSPIVAKLFCLFAAIAAICFAVAIYLEINIDLGFVPCALIAALLGGILAIRGWLVSILAVPLIYANDKQTNIVEIVTQSSKLCEGRFLEILCILGFLNLLTNYALSKAESIIPKITDDVFLNLWSIDLLGVIVVNILLSGIALLVSVVIINSWYQAIIHFYQSNLSNPKKLI